MTLALGAVSLRSTHLGHFAAALDGDIRIVRALALEDEGDLVPPAGVERFMNQAAFLDGIDGVLVLTRDARRHVRDARGSIQLGLPVFIDKPIATSVAAAAELLDTGRVCSFSVLREHPAIVAAKGRGVEHLTIRVPADPASPHCGRWFLGIHAAEIAVELLGPGLEVAAVAQEGPVLRISLRNRRVELLLDAATRDYTIEIHGERTLLDAGLAYAPGAQRIARFFRGETVLTRDEMLAPVRLLEAALAPIAGDND